MKAVEWVSGEWGTLKGSRQLLYFKLGVVGFADPEESRKEGKKVGGGEVEYRLTF